MGEELEQSPKATLTEDRRSAILAAILAADDRSLHALIDPLHPADIADLIEQMGANDRRALLALWGGQVDGETLSELDDAIREEVIDQLPATVLAEAMRELDSDDVIDILQDLDPPQQNDILGALDAAHRAAVQAALAFPEGSAGRLMQREVVALPQDWTVGAAIDHMRSAQNLPDQFYHVILTDARLRPLGYATLGRILSAQRDMRLNSILDDSFRPIPATLPEGDVAYLFNQYHLISAPVIDAAGRLVGVITIDDAMNVLDETHEQDLLRLAGVGDSSAMTDGALATMRQRLPWLVVNLVTASLSAMVIARFESTISQLVVLAALMPIVASTGGIAGTQSLAVAVRALATRDLTAANAKRVVRREMVVGLLSGIALAIILAAAGVIFFGDWHLGAVLGLAMIANQVVAALGGVLVPLGLQRLRQDPALASGTFVTTLTDVLGYLTFLGLATWMLI
jgi:magnesium transporter